MDYVETCNEELSSGEMSTDSRGFKVKFVDLLAKQRIEMPVNKYAELYKMNHHKRGIAVVFNNEVFSSRLGFKDRWGTEEDKIKFRQALLHLGFTDDDILIFDNYTAKQMKNQLQEVAALNHTNNDCLIIAIFTHGRDNLLYATDKKFNPDELWKPFLANNCVTLTGKPKIFIIQACQGEKMDEGVNVLDKGDGRNDKYKIPTYADFLISYSTVPSYCAWRNTVQGSIFIQALCQLIEQYAHEVDFVSILTLVNQKVAVEFESDDLTNSKLDKKKQIPCFMSMLMRKIVFTPKNFEVSK